MEQIITMRMTSGQREVKAKTSRKDTCKRAKELVIGKSCSIGGEKNMRFVNQLMTSDFENKMGVCFRSSCGLDRR